MTIKAKRVLLTGGRAPASLELARLLAAAGHEVFAAESIAFPLTRFSNCIRQSFRIASPREDEQRFVGQLIGLIRDYHIHILIPTCEEIFYVSKAYHRISEYCEVFTRPIHTLRMLHSKWEFIRWLNKEGMQAPDTWILHDIQSLQLILKKVDPLEQGEWILKPEFSRFSCNVQTFKGHDLSDLDMNRGSTWVLQRFIHGTQICTFAVCREGRVLAYSAYAPSYTAGGAAIHFEMNEHPSVRQWVERIAEALQYTGQLAFDLIVTGDSVMDIYPIECNPRLTSGIHLFTEADSLDQAYLNPDQKGMIIPHQAFRSNVALAMFIYGLPAVRSFHEFKHWRQAKKGARDVLFRRNDPLPLWGQLLTLSIFWMRSRKTNRTMIESSTSDIEWNGEL